MTMVVIIFTVSESEKQALSRKSQGASLTAEGLERAPQVSILASSAPYESPSLDRDKQGYSTLKGCNVSGLLLHPDSTQSKPDVGRFETW